MMAGSVGQTARLPITSTLQPLSYPSQHLVQKYKLRLSLDPTIAADFLSQRSSSDCTLRHSPWLLLVSYQIRKREKSSIFIIPAVPHMRLLAPCEYMATS